MTETNGELAIGGDGEPVEWLLVMTRFPEACRLDHVAERGELDPEVIQALARLHCRISRHARSRCLMPAASGPCGKWSVAMRTTSARSVPEAFRADAVEALIAATDRELALAAEQLEARRQAGFVRHCHGDLHLENIVLLGRQPVLFDCIEFNDAFAQIDLLYDVAFLIMDLIDRGYRREAQALLQSLQRSDGG